MCDILNKNVPLFVYTNGYGQRPNLAEQLDNQIEDFEDSVEFHLLSTKGKLCDLLRVLTGAWAELRIEYDRKIATVVEDFELSIDGGVATLHGEKRRSESARLPFTVV
jgi:hypothetical protein